MDQAGLGGPRAGSACTARHARRTAALNGIRVANAPCSYGAFEITVGVLPDVPEGERVLSAIASAGYDWTEDLAAMDATLDLFAAADGSEAKPVLADGGSAERIRFPGRAAADRSIGLDEA